MIEFPTPLMASYIKFVDGLLLDACCDIYNSVLAMATTKLVDCAMREAQQHAW
jgi:hypothetical protein